jgi:O-antigen/teichoic acid export membrane protein
MLLALITATIVPRTLGPATYGNYSFLLSTSAAIRGFLDNGTQQAFFTFSSQARSSGALTKLYALVLCGQFLVVLVLIALAGATDKTDWLWHGQQLDQIVLVTAVDWALFMAVSLQQLGDSKGRTVYPQLAAAAVSLMSLVGLVILRFSGRLDFYTFAWLNLAGAVLTCSILAYGLVARYRTQLWDGTLEFRGYIQRWWRFTRPLILLQYYFPVVAYLGLYLIQRWYGSAEMGFYALALQWSAFAMVFTTSGLSIFWREIAHSAARDLRVAAATYEKLSRLFFFLAVALSCGLSVGSAMLVQVVAGARFAAAANVLAIMAFYPISQTINQLTVASMKATERTASYARWSFLLSIPELLLTYLLLAPVTAPVPGLHLGAVGMAIKTALYGLVVAQIYDWLNCRFFKIRYAAELTRKLVAALTIGATAVVLVGGGVRWLPRLGMSDVTALCVSSCLYAAAVMLLVLLWPGVAGISREQLTQSLRPFGWRTHNPGRVAK